MGCYSVPIRWIPGNSCFSLFCQDRGQSELDQDDHTEDDAVVSEEFEVMFFDISEKNWIEYMETTKAITAAAAMKKSSIAENAVIVKDL